MVRPASVTVTAVLAASVAPAVVMTMEVAPGAAIGPRKAPPDTAPLGVELVAKKLVGYFKVMRLPGASAPPAVGVKVNVAAAPALPATRSTPATANDTFVTLPPITPDTTDAAAA